MTTSPCSFNVRFYRYFFAVTAVFLLLCTLAAPVAAETILQDDLSEWADTGSSATVTPTLSYYTTPFPVQSLILNPITNFGAINYIVVDIPTDGLLTEGRTITTYTIDGEVHTCAIDTEKSRNVLKQVTKTRYTIWLYDWDIGTLTGSQTVTFGVNLASVSGYTGYSITSGSTGIYLSTSSSTYKYAGYTYQITYSSGNLWKNSVSVDDNDFSDSYHLIVRREYPPHAYYSSISARLDGTTKYTYTGYTNVSQYIRKSDADLISIVSYSGKYYNYTLDGGGETPGGASNFTLTLSSDSVSAGDTIQGTVDTSGITYDSLHYFIDGREYITTDNPYSFTATGKVGKEYMVYVDAYYQGSFTGDSTNYIMYEITEGVSLVNQYSLSLDKDVYTQGETAIGILDDSSATDIADEIIWKVIPMQGSDGDMSTVSGFKVDYEKNGAGWLKDGEGNYTYEEVKTFSHLLDGYGEIQIEADVYNATKGLVALPYESAYVNPASWYRNAYVYLYADGGLYQGEAHITTTYILRDESRTYITNTGYKQITVVRGGDYTIHIDLEDNSKYNDVDMVYSNYVVDEKIRVYLEENYTQTEYAKLVARIVDTSGIPIYGATVKIGGNTYTSGEEGQVIHYGLDNATVSILVSKEGYQTVEASTTLLSAYNSITVTLPLLSEVTVTPTSTPTLPGEENGLSTSSPFYNFYRIFMSYGLSEDMAGIAIAMSICGVLFLLGVKFAESTSGGLTGAVVGIIFCSIAGLIPMWVIMAIILISAAVLATKMYGDGK